MKENTEINNKAQIIKGLGQSYEAVFAEVDATDALSFSKAKDGKWSIAKNLEHLILSTYPITSVLKSPKIVFKIYGKAKNGSRTYSGLYNAYKEVLASGITATPKYTPSDDKDYDKIDLLKNWKEIGEKFQTRLESWTEQDLDTYRIPHPVLGKLTMRELLFFTVFHNYHHLDAIKKLNSTK